jgi:hypothetical protein
MRDALESSSSERRPPADKQQVLKRRRSVRAGAAGGRHGHHEAVSPNALLMVLAEHWAEDAPTAVRTHGCSETHRVQPRPLPGIAAQT